MFAFASRAIQRRAKKHRHPPTHTQKRITRQKLNLHLVVYPIMLTTWYFSKIEGATKCLARPTQPPDGKVRNIETSALIGAMRASPPPPPVPLTGNISQATPARCRRSCWWRFCFYISLCGFALSRIRPGGRLQMNFAPFAR